MLLSDGEPNGGTDDNAATIWDVSPNGEWVDSYSTNTARAVCQKKTMTNQELGEIFHCFYTYCHT